MDRAHTLLAFLAASMTLMYPLMCVSQQNIHT